MSHLKMAYALGVQAAVETFEKHASKGEALKAFLKDMKRFAPSGAVGGVIPGAVMGANTVDSDERGLGALGGAGVGALIGALGGGAVGAAKFRKLLASQPARSNVLSEGMRRFGHGIDASGDALLTGVLTGAAGGTAAGAIRRNTRD